MNQLNQCDNTLFAEEGQYQNNGMISSADLLPLRGMNEELADLLSLMNQANFPRSEYDQVLQIIRELIKGHGQLAPVPASVVIWGSSRTRPNEPAYLAAMETARLLAQAGFGIITGGGPGIMEAGNKGAKEAGVISIGFPMASLAGEPPNGFLDLQLVFHYFLTRKHLFLRYASALIAFQGGFGTLDELFEALLLIQTRNVSPFPIVLHGSHFWSGLIDWMRDTLAQQARTIDVHHLDLLTISDDPRVIVERVIECTVWPEHSGQRKTRLMRN